MSKGMRKFDFEHEKFKENSRQRQEFYRNNYQKPITEEQFVAEVTSWPKRLDGNSKTRSPSKARADYHYLKRNYGFFDAAR